jgi:hypothetical protein
MSKRITPVPPSDPTRNLRDPSKYTPVPAAAMTGWQRVVAEAGEPPAPIYKYSPTKSLTSVPITERVLMKLPACSNPAAKVTQRMTMLDHALQWAAQGIHVFPCEMFLGRPAVPSWHKSATTDTATIAQWWAVDPTYDIGAVPEKSEHYVIVVTGDDGRESLEIFERENGALAPAFQYRTKWDARHLWFKGHSHSARIDPGLYLVGSGQYVYLAPSAASDPTEWSK